MILSDRDAETRDGWFSIDHSSLRDEAAWGHVYRGFKPTAKLIGCYAARKYMLTDRQGYTRAVVSASEPPAIAGG